MASHTLAAEADMADLSDEVTRRALQTVLRRKRAQIDPAEHGHTRKDPRGRHAGGLGLTQLQVDAILKQPDGTYHRLETSRRLPTRASEEMLTALAGLFRLTEHERGWLWKMTVHRDAPFPEVVAGEQVPGGWQRIMDASPHIAYCTNHRWEVLGYNEALVRALPRGEVPRNTVEWTLVHPDARVTLADWEESWARQVAPLLWAARATYPHDAVLADLEHKVLRDRQAGPIYEEFGPVYAHADAAIRPFVHAKLGPGWVTVCSATPRSAPNCQIMQMIFDPGEERPVPLPPMSAIPA